MCPMNVDDVKLWESDMGDGVGKWKDGENAPRLQVGFQVRKELPSFPDLALSFYSVSPISQKFAFGTTCRSSRLMVKSAGVDCNR